MDVAQLLLQGGQHGGQHLPQRGGQHLLWQACDVSLHPMSHMSYNATDKP